MTFKSGAPEFLARKKAATFALLQNHAGAIERHAKSHASWNDRTGHTRQAIHSGVDNDGDELVLYLSHGQETGNYMEEGTGLHGPRKQSYTIKPKNMKALHWIGGNHPVKAVTHPGIKARPIIDPTLDANMPKVRDSLKKFWGAIG
ncbi:hypothetical protein AJ85_05660 [Alkalihalobacillus alcalophilus ATCC 27647 = CGMCC 1.3604]|uniref:Uncharacterized protein n=1 Tax=Alkalihalobacillus alcalophilus ATCC 27647 = CGMCC 1.3604 TaxID=1218173 RepID=A0A094XDL5_ALKAL|nr:hypothetical protein [Alkalihalobacillus alcalophilus]YP_009276840.1 hypothetical protein BH791_gp34 [Bacillus phage BalMu-1]AJA42412.1 hypothetical protein BalMu1_B34 [Bacillus phage BalMu-1]AJA42468.1 hypothetical protein BalMu1_A34 [Bacillus phage BalMu-1]KGA96865.1 hypothetical protein BALCAV_0213690 [Alkalihalobacillus alcalophilus ATCC 27647 = CGMCC 1.3604]MED1561154.1 hypothetical protein [Alkalihalobacillus alcalophilus]THG91309.1 hypothetical protein AJ85_05660 [Alkalihalobacillus